jgi:hypothetical protein
MKRRLKVHSGVPYTTKVPVEQVLPSVFISTGGCLFEWLLYGTSAQYGYECLHVLDTNKLNTNTIRREV